MRRLLPLLLAPFLMTGLGGAESAAKRAMTIDDELRLMDIGEVVISPDGSLVLYSRSELNWDENEHETRHYLIHVNSGEEFQFIGEEGGSQYAFSPDGKYLAFIRETEEDEEGGEEEKGEEQLFLMRLDGGEALQLFRHETSIRDFKWTRDSRALVFSADEARSKEEQKRFEAGYDAVFVDEGPNGQRRGHWRNLWWIDLAGKNLRRLTHGDMKVGDFDLAPDNRRLLYTARFENRRNQQNLSEIYLLDLESQETTRLTDNKAPETNVQWDPSGSFFTFAAPDDEQWELRHDKLWRMTEAGEGPECLTCSFEGQIEGYTWASSEDRLFFIGLRRTDANLYQLDVEAKEIRPLTSLQGSASSLTVSADGDHFGFSFSDFNSPNEVYYGKKQGQTLQVHPLTDLDPWFEEKIETAQQKILRWKSRDGMEIEGILHLPSAFEEGSPAPLMLHVHGGPAGVFQNRFSGEAHIYAGLGYVSLTPNVRGSEGYGDEFLAANSRDIGGGDYQDLMTGVDFVIEQGYADRERMGIRGWSYGGILGGWTITQTDRFKAASLGAMVSDWTSEYGPGFNYDVRLWYIGGTPWENPEGYRRASALTYVDQVETPTLLLHGVEDRTDTEPQSMMFFQALKDQGKTARYIKFPRERHGFKEPRHVRTRYIEEIRWMQKYVLGEEWEAWERESPETRTGEPPQESGTSK